MEPTWIEVADTAVKIGLGAIIGLLGSYVLARKENSDALTRSLAAKKIDLLERACEEAQKYFSHVNGIYNLIEAFARDNDQSGRNQTKHETKILVEAHEGHEASLEARNIAIANISLLGANDALQSLRAFNETYIRLREIVYIQEKMLSKSEHEEFTDEFWRHKADFYAAAGAFLQRIGGGR